MSFELYNHLGFHNPYYTKLDRKIIVFPEMKEALADRESLRLDFVGLAQVVCAGFPFGDRTLVQDIKKTPWMARPDKDLQGWDHFPVPTHSEKIYSSESIAETFFRLLKTELLSYIGKKKTIGILITGGMDSRIVACVLNKMIKAGELENISVLGITWGNLGSRDVVYGKEICDLFGWEWKHLTVDAEQMVENIELAASMGCEYSPIHLHAMSKVASLREIECVLAGSFGDSVGRAEFSGVKVQNLRSLTETIDDKAGILRADYKKMIFPEVLRDISEYHVRYPQAKQYMLFEQDQQLHYMRRMLNSCMSVINSRVPLYQMFSSPEVFGFMWSLSPNLRSDLIYKIILEKYDSSLLSIPWARTGRRYMNDDGRTDQYVKSHHDYGSLIRRELSGYIKERILNSSLLDANIFHKPTVKFLLKACHSMPIKSSYFHESRLAYLASLAMFFEKYNIGTDLPEIDSKMGKIIKPAARYFAMFVMKR